MNQGSEWRRWDPHIHTPGTVLNDQFGSESWDAYLDALEASLPPLDAIGITDYYLLDSYEEVCRRRAKGRLANVTLVFPNIEVRLDVYAKSGYVNLHLLINPSDPDHAQEAARFLSQLTFSAYADRFSCSRADLIRLGKKANPAILDDKAALSHGATQFRVNFDDLRQAYGDSAWAQANILVAVAAGSNDGTSGLNQASDTTVRGPLKRSPTSFSPASPLTVNSGSVRKH